MSLFTRLRPEREVEPHEVSIEHHREQHAQWWRFSCSCGSWGDRDSFPEAVVAGRQHRSRHGLEVA